MNNQSNGGFADHKKKEERKEGQDYMLPAGWAVTVCPPAVHLNPVNYKDPLEFNSPRWERMEQKRALKNFMAFGGGMRFFVGIDFT
ncbi:hypothetical protein QVD17_00394 [Tagetes erecta]|uniref:Uncharacterized protein n=1 Tax=Tagetes erecta TaxID=13708 RepID=A0AAD8L357_TARER|nr:hypothetical protein QVD17_00394 [Tagetes erecta]